MRIGIVNDLKMAIEALRRLVEAGDGCDHCEVAWIAENGQEAVERCAQDRPDLVLMDLIMPEMDGVEATRRIMQESPCPILVVTATVDGNYAKVYDALGAGALDAVDTPTLGSDGSLAGGDDMRRKIRTIRRLSRAATDAPWPETPPPRSPSSSDETGGSPWIAIAASTGGPEALVRALAGLALDESAPIVVVQHLGADFLDGYVSWLANQTGRDVRKVTSGASPTDGQVLVAAGDDHLRVDARGHLRYDSEPRDLAYRPSADVFFTSLATSRLRPGVAIVLTGMGRDGAVGLLALRERGWATFAQDEGTSVVYGMPRAAVETGAAKRVLPVDAMGGAIRHALDRLEANARRGAS